MSERRRAKVILRTACWRYCVDECRRGNDELSGVVPVFPIQVGQDSCCCADDAAFPPNVSRRFHDMSTMRNVRNREVDVEEDGYGDTSPYDVVSKKKVGGAGE